MIAKYASKEVIKKLQSYCLTPKSVEISKCHRILVLL